MESKNNQSSIAGITGFLGYLCRCNFCVRRGVDPVNYREGLQETEEIEKELYNSDLLVDNKPYSI